MIEHYLPSHFARKFGYDQLYIGNPNTVLRFSDNLFKGAWAWYYSVLRGQGLSTAYLTRRLIVIQVSTSAYDTSSPVGYPTLA